MRGGGGYRGGGGLNGGGFHGATGMHHGGSAMRGRQFSGYRGATGGTFAARHFAGGNGGAIRGGAQLSRSGVASGGANRYGGNSFIGRHGLTSFGGGRNLSGRGIYNNFNNYNFYGGGRRYGLGGYGLGGIGLGGYGLGGYGLGGFGYGLGSYGFGFPFLGLGGLGYRLGYGLGYGGYGGYGGLGYGGYGGYGGLGYGGYGYDATGYGSGYAAQPAYAIDSETPLPTSANDFAALGEQDFRAGNYNEAVKDWQHALIDDPQNGGLYLLIGQTLFALGQYEPSAGMTQLGMQLLPQNQWGAVVGNYRELYSSSQTYQSQLRALEAAVKAKDSAAGRFLLGFQYGYLGYPAEAVRQLDHAIKLNPKDQMAEKLKAIMAAEPGVPVSPPNS